jgi:hypothetical protein
MRHEVFACAASPRVTYRAADVGCSSSRGHDSTPSRRPRDRAVNTQNRGGLRDNNLAFADASCSGKARARTCTQDMHLYDFVCVGELRGIIKISETSVCCFKVGLKAGTQSCVDGVLQVINICHKVACHATEAFAKLPTTFKLGNKSEDLCSPTTL